MMPIPERLTMALKDDDKSEETTEHLDWTTKIFGIGIIILIYIWWGQL